MPASKAVGEDGQRRVMDLSRPELSRRYLQAGQSLRRRGDVDGAADYFLACLRIDALDSDAHDGIAAVEFARGHLERAIEHSRRAVEIQPDSARFRSHLASAQLCAGFVDAAEEQLRAAVALHANCAEAQLTLGAVHLLRGRFTEGWAGHEWRPTAGRRGSRRGQPPRGRRWYGEPLDGATIVLRSEQGFGDTIQFCRYVPLVSARGGRVILEAPRQLAPLLASLSGVTEVISRDDAVTTADFEAPLGSLPGIFETVLDSIPRATPYLTADRRRRKHFQSRMSPACLNVGLVWAGNPRNPRDRLRSIALRELEPLLAVEGARFFSLQCGAAAGESARLQPDPIGELERDITDFCDTAAAIGALDLLISVDTAAAHLAGALAAPVWILLPIGPDWRWMLYTPYSPWYPTARLFRQTALGDWRRVIDTIAASLRAMVERRAGRIRNDRTPARSSRPRRLVS
jgi:hypothetical protein